VIAPERRTSAPTAASALSDLPPCPFCGTGHPISRPAGTLWLVSCVTCPGKVVRRTRHGAESAWRARAADTELRHH
jgi:hypothetical protein